MATAKPSTRWSGYSLKKDVPGKKWVKDPLSNWPSLKKDGIDIFLADDGGYDETAFYSRGDPRAKYSKGQLLQFQKKLSAVWAKNADDERAQKLMCKYPRYCVDAILDLGPRFFMSADFFRQCLEFDDAGDVNNLRVAIVEDTTERFKTVREDVLKEFPLFFQNVSKFDSETLKKCLDKDYVASVMKKDDDSAERYIVCEVLTLLSPTNPVAMDRMVEHPGPCLCGLIATKHPCCLEDDFVAMTLRTGLSECIEALDDLLRFFATENHELRGTALAHMIKRPRDFKVDLIKHAPAEAAKAITARDPQDLHGQLLENLDVETFTGPNGGTCLHFLAQSKADSKSKVEFLERAFPLVEDGTLDVKAIDKSGRAFVHHLATEQHGSDFLEKVFELLTPHMDMDQTVGNDGMTALHFCAQIGDATLARLLVANGADPKKIANIDGKQVTVAALADLRLQPAVKKGFKEALKPPPKSSKARANSPAAASAQVPPAAAAQKKTRKDVPKEVREALWKLHYGEKSQGECLICDNQVISYHRVKSGFQAAHVLADASGGEATELWNLLPSCPTCNIDCSSHNLLNYIDRGDFLALEWEEEVKAKNGSIDESQTIVQNFRTARQADPKLDENCRKIGREKVTQILETLWKVYEAKCPNAKQTRKEMFYLHTLDQSQTERDRLNEDLREHLLNTLKAGIFLAIEARLELLEKNNAELKEENAELKNAHAELKEANAALESRVARLEGQSGHAGGHGAQGSSPKRMKTSGCDN